MTAVIDLSAILPTDTAQHEILKPGSGEGTGWVITFAGPGHPKAVEWSNKSSRKNLLKQQRVEAAQVNGRKYKPEDREPDDVRRDNVAWVVAHIVDWTPVSIGGDPITFSDHAAAELLIKPQMTWAFAQMVEFLADDQSFTKGSAKG